MEAFKKWLADPDRVFITLSLFLAGMFLGLLVAPYWL